MLLERHIVEKPWGRGGLPAGYGASPAARVGEIWFETGQAQPLLIKYLFTSERLSVQVHPNDAQAKARGLPGGKDEMWIILEAEADARIAIGTREPLSGSALAAAAADGSIVDALDWRAVRAGDILYNPAGTIHAIGAGLTLVEVQQPTDCTYRLFDYGRDRPLHLAEGLAVAVAHPHQHRCDGRLPDHGSTMLCDGPHFAVAIADGGTDIIPDSAGPLWIVPLGGGIGVDGVAVAQGQCGLAADRHAVTIDPGQRALVAFIPC